jgi:hypothetical protein
VYSYSNYIFALIISFYLIFFFLNLGVYFNLSKQLFYALVHPFFDFSYSQELHANILLGDQISYTNANFLEEARRAANVERFKQMQYWFFKFLNDHGIILDPNNYTDRDFQILLDAAEYSDERFLVLSTDLEIALVYENEKIFRGEQPKIINLVWAFLQWKFELNNPLPFEASPHYEFVDKTLCADVRYRFPGICFKRYITHTLEEQILTLRNTLNEPLLIEKGSSEVVSVSSEPIILTQAQLTEVARQKFLLSFLEWTLYCDQSNIYIPYLESSFYDPTNILGFPKDPEFLCQVDSAFDITNEGSKMFSNQKAAFLNLSREVSVCQEIDRVLIKQPSFSQNYEGAFRKDIMNFLYNDLLFSQELKVQETCNILECINKLNGDIIITEATLLKNPGDLYSLRRLKVLLFLKEFALMNENTSVTQDMFRCVPEVPFDSKTMISYYIYKDTTPRIPRK